MSIQSIALSAIRFPIVSAVCLTFVLSGCLESPESFIDREVTQTPNQETGKPRNRSAPPARLPMRIANPGTHQ